jgi:hypothetical protein
VQIFVELLAQNNQRLLLQKKEVQGLMSFSN